MAQDLLSVKKKSQPKSQFVARMESGTVEWMDAEHKMDARAAQMQSLWCGCLQGSPCKTLEMVLAHMVGW